jgi:hypothetical protein
MLYRRGCLKSHRLDGGEVATRGRGRFEPGCSRGNRAIGTKSRSNPLKRLKTGPGLAQRRRVSRKGPAGSARARRFARKIPRKLLKSLDSCPGFWPWPNAAADSGPTPGTSGRRGQSRRTRPGKPRQALEKVQNGLGTRREAQKKTAGLSWDPPPCRQPERSSWKRLRRLLEGPGFKTGPRLSRP